MNILVWHWGRRGGGPLFAARLAEAIGTLPGYHAQLSLAAGAEILAGPNPPQCVWPEPTYASRPGFVVQKLLNAFVRGRTNARLAALQPDFAICAMPALLDSRMLEALRATGIPYAVIVHDAAAHPGDTFSFSMLDQRRLFRHAAALVSLSGHVAADIAAIATAGAVPPVIKLWHPAFAFGPPPAPPLSHGGPPRLLFFGRLLAYKGLDLLAEALACFGPSLPFAVRICGDGPASPALETLRAMAGVVIEQRWIAETEVPALLAWADGMILPYREASQSGVAAAALAQGRYVLATNVGGLGEQLAGQPGALLCAPNGAAIAEAMGQLFTMAAPKPVDAAADWRAMAAQLMEALARQVPHAGAAPIRTPSLAASAE